MTITRDRGNIIIECDYCHDTLDTETNDFEQALAKSRHNDWIARNFSGDWKHFDTGSCMNNYAQERKQRRGAH